MPLLNKPTPGGDAGTWGTQLNQALDDLVDVQLPATIAAQANARAEAGLRLTDLDGMTLGATVQTTWETYDGSGVIVHPSVRFFPHGFNGYRWWAAATPYAGADNQLENPSIFVSADGTDWVEPPGVSNPLYPPQTGGYNSDTHLTQGPDGRLYLFFRDFSSTGSHTEKLKLMDSADGITWSAPTMIIGNVSNVQRLMSPCAWWDGAQWVLIAVEILADPRVMVRYTAPEPYGPWTQDVTPVALTPALDTGRSPWHMDAMPFGAQVVMLLQDAVGDGAGGKLYLATSDDNGESFTRATTALASDDGNYRSCLLPVVTDAGLSLDVWQGRHAGTWGARRGTATPPASGMTAAQATALDHYSAMNAVAPFVLGDDFNRADAASLGTAASGQAWTSSLGTFGIVSGRAVPTTAANTRSTINAGAADYEASVDLRTARTTGKSGWLVARFVDGSNYLRLGIFGAGGQRFQRVTGGAVTEYATGLPALSGNDFTLRIVAQGGQVSFYINGALVITVTEPQGQTSTVVGLQADNTDVSLDNLTVKAL